MQRTFLVLNKSVFFHKKYQKSFFQKYNFILDLHMGKSLKNDKIIFALKKKHGIIYHF